VKSLSHGVVVCEIVSPKSLYRSDTANNAVGRIRSKIEYAEWREQKVARAFEASWGANKL